MSLLRKYRKKVKQPARAVHKFSTSGERTWPFREGRDERVVVIEQDIRPWLMEHAIPIRRLSKGCYSAAFTPDEYLLFKLRWL